MSYLIGVDIGTSGTKTVLFNASGEAITSASKEYPLYQPKGGWAEQRPEDWRDAAFETIRDVIAQSRIHAEEIAGIGLSGQMHGVVLLDSEGNVLRPSIIWCDQRTEKQAQELKAIVGSDRLIAVTANPALTGFSAAKILWIRENEPELFEKTRHILLPKDYVRYCLTGEFATEVSDCSGTQLMDVPARAYSSEILEKLNLDRALFPAVFESVEVSGVISPSAAAQTGLKSGTLVVGGAGDQAAGAIGNGIVRNGIVSSTIGTSGVVFAHTDNITIDPKGRVHTLCHAVPGAWHVMGVTQGAGLSLQWFRNQFCSEEMQVAEALHQSPYKLMDAIAEKVAPGCGGLIYLPYLMGERTPHLDSYARGVFFGIDATHGKKDFLRAVMEGVGYSLRDCFEILKEMNVFPKQVIASGGGGRSSLWRQMQADMFHTPVVTMQNSEGPALGVAILAAVAAGLYNTIPEACDFMLQTKSRVEPNNTNATVYDRQYPVYQAIYASLRNTFRQAANCIE